MSYSRIILERPVCAHKSAPLVPTAGLRQGLADEHWPRISATCVFLDQYLNSRQILDAHRNLMQKNTVFCILCRHNVGLLLCNLNFPDGTIANCAGLHCESLISCRSSQDRWEKNMITQNKIISLAIIGLVLGGIVGSVVDSEQVNMITAAVAGGAIGFLAGWVWNTRSGGSEDTPSGGSEDAP